MQFLRNSGADPLDDIHAADKVVLEVDGAYKSYGDTAALCGASVSLHAQEWLGLLGPNGAGKTTLVRAITGRVRLDRGRILLYGQAVAVDRPSTAVLRDIGVVSQEIALYPLLTARENLQAFGELSGLRGRHLADRVEWALEWTQLKDRSDEPIKRFSGGMKRRLNIVCSILHDPKVILLDEPTVGVDPQSRLRIWEMLTELRARGASLLFTTHQLEEAEQLCDRIVILDRGATIASGTFDELLSRTVGHQREVSLVLDGPVPAELCRPGREAVGVNKLRCGMERVAEELTPLLGDIAQAGLQVLDIAIEKPTLQAVFIHLTGRELRE